MKKTVFLNLELQSSIEQYKELGMTMIEPTVSLSKAEVIKIINREWKNSGFSSRILKVEHQDNLIKATDNNGITSTWVLYESWACDGLICAEPYSLPVM